MNDIVRFANLLEVYTFEEILEYNDLEMVDILEILYYEGIIELPPEPL